MDPTEGAARPPATRYYRGPGIQITDTWLILTGQRYAIEELDRLRTLRSRREPITLNVAVTSVAVAAVLLAGAPMLNATGWLSAAIVLSVPLFVLALGLMRRPRGWELWAEYRGVPIRLVRESDAVRYNQICRAMMRARQPPPGH